MEKQPLTFLSLPIEIRFEIYKLVLKTHAPMQLSTDYQSRNQSALGGKDKIIQFKGRERLKPTTMAKSARRLLAILKPNPHTALLSTCKQIIAEATPILVATNMIVFQKPIL
ncbi:hypothetical protein GGR53DRAFT_278972 [Hypoxylon sp. FL1150]|nr:hypothetical protein GGR53DRAFT_278972 [Hypoxylon sp. FL1150]